LHLLKGYDLAGGVYVVNLSEWKLHDLVGI